jgi:hypothetical protein
MAMMPLPGEARRVVPAKRLTENELSEFNQL